MRLSVTQMLHGRYINKLSVLLMPLSARLRWDTVRWWLQSVIGHACLDTARDGTGRWRTMTMTPRPIHLSPADVTLKCLPHEKSARKEIITDLICLPLLKNRRPHKMFPHYKIAPLLPEKFSRPTIYRQKICPALRPPGRDGFLPVNFRPGETFLGSDPVVGHRRLTAIVAASAQHIDRPLWLPTNWPNHRLSLSSSLTRYLR